MPMGTVPVVAASYDTVDEAADDDEATRDAGA